MIIDKNTDELIVFVKEMIKEEYPTVELDDTQAKDLVYQFVDVLVQNVPTVEQLEIFGENATDETKETIEAIRLFYEGSILVPFVIIAIVLSILILLLRLNKYVFLKL